MKFYVRTSSKKSYIKTLNIEEVLEFPAVEVVEVVVAGDDEEQKKQRE